MRQLAAAASTELRAVLLDLHDAVLEQQGLLRALEAYAAVVRQRSGLQVELRLGEPLGEPCAACLGTTGPGAQVPRAHEEALYYVAREALTNVVKHARTTHATVTLWWGKTVRLVVEDDGVGFDRPAEAEPGAYTYGLAGMRERVAALGGRLRLENRAGGGARVVAELPVGEAADR